MRKGLRTTGVFICHFFAPAISTEILLLVISLFLFYYWKRQYRPVIDFCKKYFRASLITALSFYKLSKLGKLLTKESEEEVDDLFAIWKNPEKKKDVDSFVYLQPLPKKKSCMNLHEATEIIQKNQHLIGKKDSHKARIDDIVAVPVKSAEDFFKTYLIEDDAAVAMIGHDANDVYIEVIFNKEHIHNGVFFHTAIENVKGDFEVILP